MSHDVLIVGDGPAGRALGAACTAAGLDVLVVGDARPWTATYGAWADEVGHLHDAAASITEIDVVGTPPRRRLDRRYLVFDNTLLAARLDVAPRAQAHVESLHHTASGWSAATTSAGDVVLARLAVDATGSEARLLTRRPASPAPSFQSAYGLVVDGRPDVGGDAAILMDWRSPGAGDSNEPTFLYLVDVGAGRWLVEETSLARRTPMAVGELRYRLAARLGRDLTDRAEHVEHVVVPMWPGVPSRQQATVGFGAAAGYIHPATGYSVAASIEVAPRVAGAIAYALQRDDPASSAELVWNALWPADTRRARALHDYGLAALLRLQTDEVQSFFDAFFELPTEWWSAYLRVDTTATEVARVMSAVFRAVPWTVRRRLLAGNPMTFARLLR
jgi:lycopene beta-cyclase